MLLISVNCGLPRAIVWNGTTVITSIYKEPLRGRVMLRTLNLDGDRQSDLTVHGGKDKAVYCYSMAHYAYWKLEMPDRELPMGVFGENFTLENPSEDEVHIGERFSVGSAEVVVTQPRLPCYKLDIRFEANDMVRRFLHSGRTGFYVAVLREGDVGAGDDFRLLSREAESVPVSEVTRLYIAKSYSDRDVHQIERLLNVESFPASWKEYFHDKASRLAK